MPLTHLIGIYGFKCKFGLKYFYTATKQTKYPVFIIFLYVNTNNEKLINTFKNQNHHIFFYLLMFIRTPYKYNIVYNFTQYCILQFFIKK